MSFSGRRRAAARIGSVALVASWVLSSVGGAGAQTVTVGSPLTGPFFSTLTCGAPEGCTWANTGLSEPGANVTSPVSGTIVRWRIAGNYTGPFTLRVLHRSAGGRFTGVASSPPVDANGTTTRTFPASLPIQAGDLIGIDYPLGRHLATASVMGSAFSEWFPPLRDGATEEPASVREDLEILFNADVQPPPGIAALSVVQGSIAGGTSVTISGHDFTEARAVMFGGVPAPSFTVDSDSQITAISPPSARPGPVDISVTTAVGTTAASLADQFNYTACVIPKLKGRRVRAARKKLKAANCLLGRVTGHRDRATRVRKQSPKPGAVLPPGSKVNVRIS